MKKLILVSLAVIFCGAFSFGQHVHSERCGHDLLMESMEAQYPGYQDAVRATFDEAKERAESGFRSNDVYTIDVVVHVVWNQPEENLPDSIIEQQMLVLNENYRHINADAVNLRPEFEPLVGDPMIEFNLEEVVRVQTSAIFEAGFGGLPDATLKSTAAGGSDAWDTERYLNIWVCNVSGGLGVLGYAYPPANLANWPAGANASQASYEGVVIHYPAFQPNTTYSVQGENIDIQGRTAVHEVGHFLGLPHIWGNSILASLGIADCDGDDGIADTPVQGLGSNFQCDVTQNTCDEGAGDLPDMFENYMDYAQESCQVAFTQGQIDLMRSVLEGPRSGLIGLSPVSTNDIDVIASGVELYPNPTTGLITLAIANEDSDVLNIQVRNAVGQVVKQLDQVDYASAELSLDLGEFSEGVYFVEISNGKSAFAKKVVLTK